MGLLKARLFLPRTCGGWALAAFLIMLVFAASVFSARDVLYRTYLGLQPEAQNVGPATYVAGERPNLKKTAGGVRVTVTSIYAEEQHVVVGYEVDDLRNNRRVGEHPAELHPLFGFGGSREEEYRREHGLGTDILELNDESGMEFRIVNNSGAVSGGPDNMARGPLQNMVAFEPERGLEPGEKHRFRLKVPLVESPVVAPEQKMPAPEPFRGGPFVFDLEVPVQAVRDVEVGQESTAKGVTLTLERVTDSPGHPEVVICLESMDGVRGWVPGGRDLGFEYFKPVAGEGDCLRMPLSRPLDDHPSVTVDQVEINPFCPSCAREEDVIRGPWTFEFEVPDS